MSFIIQKILARQRSILNRITWEKRKRSLRGTRLPIQSRQELCEEKSVPLFGSTPGAFGLDWAFRKSVPPAPQGVVRQGVAPPIKQRRASTITLKPLRVSESEIQTGRRLSYRKTDQHVAPTRRSSGSNWDGIVRNKQNRPSYLTAPRKAGKQKPESSIKNDPYSFY